MLRRSSGAPPAPHSTSALYARGNALQAQGHLEEAAACYCRALKLDPDHTDARFNLATTLITLGRNDEAEALLRKTIAAGHASADVLQNLGIALAAQQRHPEAEASFRQALAAGPPSAALYQDLALTLHHQLQHAAAIDCLERALDYAAENAELRCNLGEMLFQRGETGPARAHLQAALGISPGHKTAAARLGCLDLLDGKILQGWRGYRLLMREALVGQNAGIALDDALPENLDGKRVLLLGEQGIGDELLFLRYARVLKQRGATIFYRAESRIGAVLNARTTVLDRILAPAGPMPARDFTVLIGDLPALLGSDAIPPAFALAPLDARRNAMHARLAACGPPPYLGVGWRAGLQGLQAPELPVPLAKQIPLPTLAQALQGVSATLVALQRHPHPGELDAFANLAGRPVHDFTSCNDDLDDALALLDVLDDYVAVSNTNMHLLASLGRMGRVLMPCPPDWRWMASGRYSPWFPGFAIYRQNGDGDWSSAMRDLQRDLVNPTA